MADRIGRVHAAVAELRAALEAAYPGADVKGVSHIETVECLLADCGHTVTWNGQKFCKPGQMTVVNFSALYSREHATMDDLLAATEDKL